MECYIYCLVVYLSDVYNCLYYAINTDKQGNYQVNEFYYSTRVYIEYINTGTMPAVNITNVSLILLTTIPLLFSYYSTTKSLLSMYITLSSLVHDDVSDKIMPFIICMSSIQLKEEGMKL